MPCFREEISFVNKAKFSLCSGLLKENLNEIDGVEIKWNESSYFFAAPKEPNLPPPEMKLKEEWVKMETKSFNDWKIEKFIGWSGVADGGSMAFEFLTVQGIEFDVLVANSQYWTDADKKAKSQVIYLIESGRFYLLVPESTQEKQLLRILTKAATTQKGKGRVSPKYITALIEKIKDRKPPEYYWPMTKEEFDEANKQASKQTRLGNPLPPGLKTKSDLLSLAQTYR